jgi:hypothetical protein
MVVVVKVVITAVLFGVTEGGGGGVEDLNELRSSLKIN